MTCPSPTLILSDVLGRRRRDVTPHDVIKSRARRQTGPSVNAREDVVVEVSFKLDGVEAYRNLTGGPLDDSSRLTVYYDPEVFPFESPDQTLIFTSTWPIEEKLLEIKVSRHSSNGLNNTELLLYQNYQNINTTNNKLDIRVERGSWMGNFQPCFMPRKYFFDRNYDDDPLLF